MYKTTTAVLIAGLLIYILYLTQCRSQKPCPQPVFERIDTQKIITNFISTWQKPKPDTIIKRVVRVIPGNTPDPTMEYRDTGSVVYLQKPIDTPALIQDYFSIRVYKDSLKLKHGIVRLTDSISENQIMARQWHLQDTTPSLKVRQPRQLYIGGGGYFNLKPRDTFLVSAIHMDLGYINRRGDHFKISAMRTTKNWQGGVSFYKTIWKIY